MRPLGSARRRVDLCRGKDDAIRSAHFILTEGGLEPNPEGRFESIEDTVRAAIAAAADAGLPAERSMDPRTELPIVHVRFPDLGGEVTISENVNWLTRGGFERSDPFRETYAGSADTREAFAECVEAAHRLLRRGAELID